MAHAPQSRKRQTLQGYERQYEHLKEQLRAVGYVLQGSVLERWMECGKPSCRCHDDPASRHGPYWQWSWKKRGKTLSVYLTPEKASLCRKWIENHRRMDRIFKQMRELSLRIARLHELPLK